MEKLTIRYLLEYNAINYPEDIVFSFYNDDRSEILSKTFKQFYREVKNIGSWLINKGYKNKHIAILSENSIKWALSFFSITSSKNVAVLLDTNLNSEELKNIIAFNDCEAIIYSSMFEKEIDAIKDSLNIEYILNDELLEIAKIDSDLILDVEVNEDDNAAIAFTSGSSGIRKGVLLKHNGLVGDAYSVTKHIFVKETYLHFLPSYHLFAILGIMAAIALRVNVFLCSSLRHLTKDIEKTNFGIITCVPATLPLILQGIKNLEVKPREIICGGAPNSQDLTKEFKQLNATIINGYGLTECSPCISISGVDNYETGGMHILDINEVLIDEKDENGIGEILVKGINVMSGYYKMEEENKKVFKNGYFCTGDLGKIDENGYLYVLGRKKNIIVLPNGENIAPEPLEKEISSINGVKECIVNMCDGVLCANVYAPDSDEAYIREEIKNINSKHNFANRITTIKLVDKEFEKGSTGKILRRKL